MITVDEADKIISQNITKYPSIKVPLQDAFGKVLQEDLVADRDIPPFDRVTMDGIGINFSAWKKGSRVFLIEGVQKAGMPPLKLPESRTCFEVMTGAVLPDGCDCVIPYEDIEMRDAKAHLREGIELCRMQNIHAKGSDCKSGTCLLSKGNRLLAPQVAVAASIGKAEVLVSANPKIAVIGTGDEVVDIHKKEIEFFQVRQSNSYAVEAALELAGYDQITRFHIQDDKDELREGLEKILSDFDVLILSGGVSRGKFDYIPEVLGQLGVKALFHKVRQRPGKPFWFGKSKNGKPVFALPGNPVSTQIGLYRYVLPYLNAAANEQVALKEFAVLKEDIEIRTDFTYFLPVKIKGDEGGGLLAAPVFPNVSGDYAALAKTDGFLELPAGIFRFPKGTSACLYRWKI